MDPLDLLRQALDAVREFASNPDIDESETLQAEQVTTLIQKLLAAREKEERDLLGGKMSVGALGRALSGGQQGA
jgi:hypothetical protein